MSGKWISIERPPHAGAFAMETSAERVGIAMLEHTSRVALRGRRAV
jgi:hypothetical protein